MHLRSLILSNWNCHHLNSLPRNMLKFLRWETEIERERRKEEKGEEEKELMEGEGEEKRDRQRVGERLIKYSAP